ncbi:MAG: TetR family transcriptional regulator [Leptospiraceae bacterium]|nr:MAG: TetR family transcriptional regulator [Leptospiraceae bacterium]
MPKVVDHDKYRQYVLEKCVDIFYQKGYRNVTLKDIAKHLNVSVGSLYYYFPSKKHLFQEMYKMLQQKSKEEFHEILKDCKTPYEKVEKFIKSILENPTIVQKQSILIFDLVREDSPKTVKKISFQFIRQFALILQDELQISFEQSQMILVFAAGLIQGNFILKNKKFFQPPVNEFLKLMKKELR